MVYSLRKASYNSSNFHSLSLFATSSSMNVLRCQNSNKTQDNYASIIFSQASCVSLMLFYYACLYSIYVQRCSTCIQHATCVGTRYPRHATHNPHKRAVQASNWTKLPAVAHCPANHVYNTKAFTRVCGKILRMER